MRLWWERGRMAGPGLDMARLCREHAGGDDAVFWKESWRVGRFLTHPSSMKFS